VAVDFPARRIQQLAFSANGKRLAVGWIEAAATGFEVFAGMTILDAETGAERASLRIGKGRAAGSIPAMVVSADSETLAIRGGTDRLELWDAPSSRLRETIRAETGYRQVSLSEWVFSPDGRSVSTVRADGTVGLWDAATGEPRFLDEQAEAPAPLREALQMQWRSLGDGARRPFTFSADGKTLGVVCRDGAVHLWNIPSAQLRTVLPPPVPPLASPGLIVFSADNRYLALAGEGAPPTRIDRLPAVLRDILHPVGESGQPEMIGRLIVWDLTAGRHRLDAQSGGRFSALAFAPNGSRLAAAREEFFFSDDWFSRGKTVRDVMLWSLD
jgi:WD40 repeat protein